MTYNLGDPSVLTSTSPGDDAILLGAASVAAARPTPYKWSALWAYFLAKAGDAFGYTVGTSEGQIPLLGAGGKLSQERMNLASVSFTGTPTAPTATLGTNTDQLSTTAFVQAAINALINAAPGALDTLGEISDALGDDASYAATLTAALALKAPLASPAFTGTPTAPTATLGTSTTQLATTEFVQALLNSAESVVASATTTDIGATTSVRVEVTGTTTITSLGTVANRFRIVRFSGALTLTHNGTSLILPTAANITTAAGDMAIFASNGSGNWRCLAFERASGRPFVDTRDIRCAQDVLAGEEGFAIDAVSRSAVIVDFSGAKSNSGKPEDLLTVTRAGANAAYIDSDRLLKYAAANTIRYTHDPATGERLGMLVEPAATNLLIRSEEISNNTVWPFFAVTKATDDATAPDGATTADSITEMVDSNSHPVQQSVVTVAATTYTFSAFVKLKAGTRFVGLSMNSNANNDTWVAARFNLTTGRVQSSDVKGTGFVLSGTAIQNYGNGWYRVSVTGRIGANTDMNCIICLANDATTPYEANNRGRVSYVGDGTSGIHIWGAQLEAGLTATSYIPTTTGSATRNADSITLLITALPGDASVRGTLFVEFSPVAFIAGSRFLSVRGTDNNNAVYVLSGFAVPAQLRVDVNVGGASQASMTLINPMIAGSTYKVATSYSANDFVAFVNGGVPPTPDTSGTVPTVTTLAIGESSNGIIRRAAWFSRDFTDVELQSLTA